MSQRMRILDVVEADYSHQQESDNSPRRGRKENPTFESCLKKRESPKFHRMMDINNSNNIRESASSESSSASSSSYHSGKPIRSRSSTDDRSSRRSSASKQQPPKKLPKNVVASHHTTPNKQQPRSASRSNSKSARTNSNNSTIDNELRTAYLANVRSLFAKANEYLHPGFVFRSIVHLFAERKLLVFFLIHFACTMIIWFHFAFIKFHQQKDAVPAGAPSYWWKRLVPPLEFGSMHAILFQMALIPLTMSRCTISALSESAINRFVPLNRVLRMHIHLGYTMVLIVFLATVFFLIFFGLLCSRGEDDFCDKFTSEIMITGYCILGSLLLIAGTSYFRHKIPYEVFYAIHHLVFIMYGVTVAHTFDFQQRSGQKNRSQTFTWFSATLLYYICDRAAVHMNQKYQCRLLSSSAITGGHDGRSRMLMLKLRRPALFRFRPGQYAYLKLGMIDPHWHPFSIASDPESTYLEFYVEVFDDKSWTGQLWALLNGTSSSDDGIQIIDIEVMGPFGVALAKTEDYSHILAIGTGTGIVPVASLFKQHIRQLLRLAPDTHRQELRECHRRVVQVETAREQRKGSFAQGLWSLLKGYHEDAYAGDMPDAPLSKSDSIRETLRTTIAQRAVMHPHQRREVRHNQHQMQQAAFRATRSIYGVVLLSILPVFGISLIALNISWNTMNAELLDGMVEILQVASFLFHFVFAAVSLCLWDANHLLAYTDLAFCLVAPFADWYWFSIYKSHGTLRPGDIVLYSLLTGYMVFRSWSVTVKPRQEALSGDCYGLRALERLDVVWVSRSASLVAEILPDIVEAWQLLADAWGEESAASVCRISVYITERDASAVEVLLRELSGTPIYEKGWIHFGRPDFAKLIEDQSVDLISTRRSSRSLLAYVGSAQLARKVHHLKISNDIAKAITGHKKHQMEFVSESYGGCKPKARIGMHDNLVAASDSEGGDTHSEATEELEVQKKFRLTTRRTTSYGGDRKPLLHCLVPRA